MTGIYGIPDDQCPLKKDDPEGPCPCLDIRVDDKICVLIIEDDQEYARALVSILGDFFEIRHAGSLAEGKAIFDETDPDVILLDLCLPDSSLDTTVSKCVNLCPLTPIVVLSSSVDDTTRDRDIDNGAVDAINKADITPSALIRILKTAYKREHRRVSVRTNNQLLKVITRLGNKLQVLQTDPKIKGG